MKYHKCSGNLAKYFSDFVTAYAYPFYKTRKLNQERLLLANMTHIPVQLLQSAGHINTSYNQLLLNFVKVLSRIRKFVL